jgi:hypothetical protein
MSARISSPTTSSPQRPQNSMSPPSRPIAQAAEAAMPPPVPTQSRASILIGVGGISSTRNSQSQVTMPQVSRRGMAARRLRRRGRWAKVGLR